MSGKLSERMAAARERYNRAGHAIQTGVALDQAKGSQDGTPKHLRVGLNLRASDHAALTHLLIEKGIITREEYYEAVATHAEYEVSDYETRLKVKLA